MCLTVPGRILSVDASDPDSRVARVEFGETVKQVSLLYTPEATVGSFVIVHAGYASQVIPEADAQEALEYARQLGATSPRGTDSASASAARAVAVE